MSQPIIKQSACSTVQLFENKVIKTALVESENERIENEANALKLLEESGVGPRLVQQTTEGELVSIEMEKLTGSTLHERTEEIVKIKNGVAMSLIATVCAMHDENIIHCDLKPSNIIVTDKQEVRLLDFGCSQDADEAKIKPFYFSTPAITPPELCLGETAWTKQGEVWSLGVNLYYLYSGKMPFGTGLREDVAANICFTRAKPIKHKIWPLIKNCLQRNPVDRYTTSNEVLRDFVKLSGGEEIEDRTPSLGTNLGRSFNRVKWLAASIALFLTFVCAVSAAIGSLFAYDDGLTLIRFDHQQPVSKVVMKNSKHQYTFDGDETVKVEPGLYWVKFIDSNGKEFNTVRRVFEIDLDRIFGKNDVVEYSRIENQTSHLKGMQTKTSDKFEFPTIKFNGVTKQIGPNDRMSYQYVVSQMDRTGDRLPIVAELIADGKDPSTYLALDNFETIRIGLVYPIPRSKKIDDKDFSLF